MSVAVSVIMPIVQDAACKTVRGPESNGVIGPVISRAGIAAKSSRKSKQIVNSPGPKRMKEIITRKHLEKK